MDKDKKIEALKAHVGNLERKLREVSGGRFKEGVSWHDVVAACGCGQEHSLVADELGEDCNAYDLAAEWKGSCESCGQTKRVRVLNGTDRPAALQ